MLIEVRCPNGHVLHVKEKHAGKIGVCPHCSAPVRVPLAVPVHGNDLLKGLSTDQAPPGPVVLQELRHDRMEWSSAPNAPGSFTPASKGKLCLGCGRIVSQSFAICPQCGTPVSSYRHLQVQKEGDTIIVQFGKYMILDEATVKAIIEELCGVAELAERQDLVLNLSKVISLSSLMLGKLVMLQKQMEKKKRQLRLRNVGPEVRDVLAATKLDQVLHIEEH